MVYEIKQLVVVLALALIAFALTKRVSVMFMSPADFARRRNVWITLTCVGFLSPNIWLFAAVALPLVYWAGKVDRHPTALYAFLFLTMPPAAVPIPLPLVNLLFDLSPFRILALALLLPAAVRLVRAGVSRTPGIARADLAVLAFGLLQLVIYIPYESSTNTVRRALLFGLDVYALYFVFSRAATNREALRDTLASYWLACAVLVPVVVFENLRSWLLYTTIPDRWGAPNLGAYLSREGLLRAQGPAGHSLTMGILLATAFGFWLYVGGRTSKRILWTVGLLMWAGLFATFSRAPWIVAAFVMIIYVLLSPAGRKHLFGILAGVGVALGALSLTAFGGRIISTLPFIGTAEQSNVDYRQQVAEVSWRLIKQNPFFGDPFAARNMEELRQGQGIIDLVNTYASIGVFYGLVGVAIFVTCFVYPAWRSGTAMLATRGRDADDTNLGAVLVACMLGILLMMATASFGSGFEFTAWMLAGLCSAYPAVVYRGNTAGAARRVANAGVAPIHAPSLRRGGR
jgi:hypothetical protein